MTRRIRALSGPIQIYSGTFHALAKQILTQQDSSMGREMFFIDELPVRWTQWMRTDKGRKWVSGLR